MCVTEFVVKIRRILIANKLVPYKYITRGEVGRRRHLILAPTLSCDNDFVSTFLLIHTTIIQWKITRGFPVC